MPVNERQTRWESVTITVLGVALWMYLFISVATLTLGTFNADLATLNAESAARIARSQGDAERAVEKDTEASRGHDDRMANTSSAWIGVGLSLVGLVIVHGRRP